MKELIITQLPNGTSEQELPAIAEILMQIPSQSINIINWKEYPYQPNVSFRLACDDTHFYLRYDVREKYIAAKATENNGSVWLDSCVEFFLSPEENDVYYNFEFNCIGTKLLGYRKLGDSTQHADEEIMTNIRCESSLGDKPLNEKTGDFSWYLVAVIPISSCWKDSIESLRGKTMKANFYKCGDELTEAHFLSWNPIQTEKPSFHQPAFFGKLVFP